MNLFKKMEEWEKDLPEEFHGTKQNAENAERAEKIINHVEEIRKGVTGATSIIRNVDCPYYPDSSTYLTLPNYTHMMNQTIQKRIAELFELADIVSINTSSEQNICFIFTVLNIWAE